MTESDDRQNLLAEVFELAQLRHELGQMQTEVRLLLEQAERNAARGGLPPSLIARAAGLTHGRITQILARPGDADMTPTALRKVSNLATGWPADALKRHRESFPGTMTYPPYPAPRARA